MADWITPFIRPPASYKFGPKREIYFLDADPLVVVASWRVGKAKVLGDHDVEYPVEFGVLAVSEGTGVPSWFRPTGRELRVVPSATTKRITYKLRYASGRWNLVDPPPPCVGVIALIAFFQNDLKQLLAARRAYTLNKVGPHALENNLLIEQWERKQLKFLLSLHQSIAGH